MHIVLYLVSGLIFGAGITVGLLAVRWPITSLVSLPVIMMCLGAAIFLAAFGRALELLLHIRDLLAERLPEPDYEEDDTDEEEPA